MTKSQNNTPAWLTKKRHGFSGKQALAMSLLFGVFGSYFLWSSFAAGPEVIVTTAESEQLSLPVGSSVFADSGASGSQAIKLVGASGSATGTFNLPSASNQFDVVAKATSCNGLWPKLTVYVDANPSQTTTVGTNTWATYGPVSKLLAVGSHSIILGYVNQRHGNCYTTLSVDMTRFYQPAPVGPLPLGVPGTWNMKFSDEFNDTSLDLTKWRPNWCHWAGCTDSQISKAVNDAHEASCYDPAQVSEKGTGYLNLQAVSKICTPPDYAHTYDYASGLVQSANHYTFTYGYMEARVWVSPAGSTTPQNWNSFWTVGTGTWPTTGEIDVMESLGGQYCYHTHFGTSVAPLQAGGCAAKSISGWHTFGANWQPAAVTFYYDGIQVGQVTGSAVPTSPQFLVGQYALSSVISPPIVVPSNMLIDYIRVWQ